MKVLLVLLSCFVGISIEQCTTEDFRGYLRYQLFSPSEVIDIGIYYNCLSPFNSTNLGSQYSSMSVSVSYGQKKVHYSARCINGTWKIVGNQSTTWGNNNLRYCEDCTDITSNCAG